MAIKGAVCVVNIAPVNGDEIDVQYTVVSLETSVPYSEQLWTGPIDPSALTNQTIIDAAQASLVTAGVTFGGGDSVVLVPA